MVKTFILVPALNNVSEPKKKEILGHIASAIKDANLSPDLVLYQSSPSTIQEFALEIAEHFKTAEKEVALRTDGRLNATRCKIIKTLSDLKNESTVVVIASNNDIAHEIYMYTGICNPKLGTVNIVNTSHDNWPKAMERPIFTSFPTHHNKPEA